MSEEQLKAFLAKVQSDASLQEQLKAEGADPVAIAKAAGFTITIEDLQADQQNLSDQELEGAAGGGGCRRDASVGDRLRCNDLWSKV
ncbi:Nif11-like leader peptide family natural product precursor [Prochlorococcus sp. MIT 1201]|uniref:Nif11-like leader peptide family natural product precursor n=1 Tax=Prochlorococcus sp. MIT 1201 TaxID=3082535 RepID=UPI0039A5DA75